MAKGASDPLCLPSWVSVSARAARSMGRLSQDALTAPRVSSALVLLTKVSTLSLINMQAASAGDACTVAVWLAVRLAAASKAVSIMTS